MTVVYLSSRMESVRREILISITYEVKRIMHSGHVTHLCCAGTKLQTYTASHSAVEIFSTKKLRLKLCFEMKSTTYEFGHFTSISGHFFANYMNIFHKTKVLLVILRIQTYLKLNWIKSYNMKYKISQFSFRAGLPKWILTLPKETSSHVFKMALFPKIFRAFKKHITR